MGAQQVKDDVKIIIQMMDDNGRVNGYLPSDVLTAKRLGISVIEVESVMREHEQAVDDLAAIRDKLQ